MTLWYALPFFIYERHLTPWTMSYCRRGFRNWEHTMLSCDGYKITLIIAISESSVVIMICIQTGELSGEVSLGKSTRDTINFNLCQQYAYSGASWCCCNLQLIQLYLLLCCGSFNEDNWWLVDRRSNILVSMVCCWLNADQCEVVNLVLCGSTSNNQSIELHHHLFIWEILY